MRHGLFVPIFDELANPSVLAQLAAEAEQAGWDGVYLWDHIYFRAPVRAATDPWVSLAAMAATTEKIRLGPMVTPLARRRPQILARALVALDQLSGGRMTFGAGLGLDTSGGELSRFGEELDDRRRAQMLDEGLGLLRELCSGQPVDHQGEFYRAEGVRFLPRAVQDPLPIWIGARWPFRHPLLRAARFEGVFLIDLVSPADLASARQVVIEARGGVIDDFDIAVRLPPGASDTEWTDAGATWVLTSFDPFSTGPATVRAVINHGP